MAMELNETETFVTIHRVGGFGRAATILHISQPALSRREAGQAFLPLRSVRFLSCMSHCWLSLLPLRSLSEELRPGIVRLLPIAALQTTVPVMLIHRCKAYLSHACRRLKEMLTE